MAKRQELVLRPIVTFVITRKISRKRASRHRFTVVIRIANIVTTIKVKLGRCLNRDERAFIKVETAKRSTLRAKDIPAHPIEVMAPAGQTNCSVRKNSHRWCKVKTGRSMKFWASTTSSLELNSPVVKGRRERWGPRGCQELTR